MRITNFIFTLLVLFLMSGCGRYFQQPVTQQKARLGEDTHFSSELRSLPAPNEKLVAAVYKFRDQTGQYKQVESGISYSTAVTQGATNILLKALEESNWFVTIERENVSNLLNERKIIRSSMTQFRGENEALPPLLFGGIILEGGIISYDANIITGGAGLRYFGAGGSTRYRQDRVTVYLRAVATKTGKVLKTVYTSKTILSQAVDIGLFRYVKFKRLLETETGYTTNEPSQLAVTEAIEKSVYALVVEGLRDGLWVAGDKVPEEQIQNLIKNYEEELNEARETDVCRKKDDYIRPKVSVSPYASLLRYEGDYGPQQYTAGAGLSLQADLTPYLSLHADIASGRLSAQEYYKQDITTTSLNLQYKVLPFQRITPFFSVGYGVTNRGENLFDFSGQKFGGINSGLGVEYMVSPKIGVYAAGQYTYFINDKLDDVVAGGFNDSYWKASGGIRFYFGNQHK